MVYHCVHCDYTTPYSSNWSKHQKTSKHIRLIKQIEDTVITSSNIDAQIDESNKELIDIVNDLRNQMREMRTYMSSRIESLESEVEALKTTQSKPTKLSSKKKTTTNSIHPPQDTVIPIIPRQPCGGYVPPPKEKEEQLTVNNSVARPFPCGFVDEPLDDNPITRDIQNGRCCDCFNSNRRAIHALITYHYQSGTEFNIVKFGKTKSNVYDGNKWIDHDTEEVIYTTVEHIIATLKRGDVWKAIEKNINAKNHDEIKTLFNSYDDIRISKSHMKNIIDSLIQSTRRGTYLF